MKSQGIMAGEGEMEGAKGEEAGGTDGPEDLTAAAVLDVVCVGASIDRGRRLIATTMPQSWFLKLSQCPHM